MAARAALTVVFMIFIFTGAGTQEASPSGAPLRIEVTAHRFAYEPDSITLRKGQAVMLELRSDDVTHGLRIRELGLDLRASRGKPGETVFTPGKAGDFTGHCSVFCGAKHGTMKITFHVVE